MSPLSVLFLSSGDPTLDRRHQWAKALIEEGDAGAAAELLEETLVRAPGFIAGWFLLGEARALLDERNAAATAFRRVIALDPGDRLGAGLRLARLGARKVKHSMSRAYICNLFDQYAGRFERDLVETLHYNAPALLRAGLEETAGARKFARVLDIGCGTGLMGEAIRDRAGELCGVDISAKMVEMAGRKNLYDRLVVGELLESLGNEANPFDLVLAADVFVYFSDLKPVFAAVKERLSPSGLFAFTVETHEEEGVILRDTLRFAHGTPYLRATAAEAGLDVPLLKKVSTRHERNVPVGGLLAVLRAPE